jgi:murein DD-endopeptidase MepM/ murein hydrolase activator NlpD
VSSSSIPATTIVYLTIPRTTEPSEVPPSAVTTAPVAPSTTSAPQPTVDPSATGTAVSQPREFVFPVSSAATKYASSHHDYPAADMFAACGTAVVAPTDATVEETQATDEWDPDTDDPAQRSGLLVSLVDDRGVRYYGSHLSRVMVSPGQRVAAGEQVGAVGDSGNAAGTGCHLHFGLSPACLTGWRNRRGLTYPQPFLDDWRTGLATDPLAAVQALGCG